jgi:hypothetical protein
MQAKQALKNLGAGVLSMVTAGVAFAVPWLVLSPTPSFFGVSVRTATAAIACAAVAILAWAALNRRADPKPAPQGQTLAKTKALPASSGRYIHQACGAHFDEPSVFEDFISKKKFYACPGCSALMGEMINAPPPELPKVPQEELPKPEPVKPPEQRVILTVEVKGPADAKVVAGAGS